MNIVLLKRIRIFLTLSQLLQLVIETSRSVRISLESNSWIPNPRLEREKIFVHKTSHKDLVVVRLRQSIVPKSVLHV